MDLSNHRVTNKLSVGVVVLSVLFIVFGGLWSVSYVFYPLPLGYFVTGMPLLIGGIGMLRRKHWALRLSQAVFVISVLQIIVLVFYYALTDRHIFDFALFSVVEICLAFLVLLVLPTWILFRRSTVDRFRVKQPTNPERKEVAVSKDDDPSGGSRWSKILYAISLIALILAVVNLCSKVNTYDPVSKVVVSSETPWTMVILCFVIAIIASYISYRIAGGRNNPSLKPATYKGADHTDRSDGNRVTIESVAETLYKTVFRTLSDAMSKYVHERVVDKGVLRNTDTHVKLKLECDTLMAFLTTFLFRSACESSGQDQATNSVILDRFHEKLALSVTPSESLVFGKLLKTRYAEYYSILEDDLEWLRKDTGGETIPFRGVAEFFLGKIAPDKARSEELILFSLTFGKLYTIWGEFLNKIAKYKIG
jgi:hypothetical protein